MKKFSTKFCSIFALLIILLFPAALSAQEKLTNLNPSWTAVLPGTALSQPAVTSYGFCLATDARNLMGFSSNGNLLWEKNIGRVRNLSVNSLKGDFILFHDINKNLIKLFNPSGTEIWTKSLDFKPISGPLEGRDGRFFLNGDGQVICLGINGIIRWKLQTESQKDLPMQELPDGSLVVFLSDINGHTRGLRISPFGEMLENITFAGSIKRTESCNEGILLTFTDGTAGLFALNNGLAESKWVAAVKAGNPLFVVSPDKSSYRLLALSQTEITLYKINSQDGSVSQSRNISGIDGTALQKAVYSDAGLFLADSKNALLLDEDFREIWSAQMPDTVRNKTVNQIIYLKDDYLVFCGKNWTMNAYHTSQTTKNEKNNNSVLKNAQSDYSSFAPIDLNDINYYNMGSFFAALKSPSRAARLKEGLYGTDEKEWLSQTLSVAKLFAMDAGSSDFGIHTDKSVFQTDSAGFEAILLQLALLSTDQTQDACASIIASSTNKSYCRAILSNICGYDPDGKLLDAIERNALKAGNKDSAYLKTICDAVYSICLFMVRPAYHKKGKDILKSFMGAGYSSNTRNYARDTLKKIIAIEL